ncbi:MAG: FCD domain-containing protein [Acidimicrobiia bacterium]
MAEGAKLAEILAYQLESEIIDGDWTVGDVIGQEPELMRRYRVSRAVFREAVRIVEGHLVGRMRRGRNGGLVVTEPTPQAVSDVMRIYLRSLKVDDAELFEARVSIESVCLTLAMERLTSSDEQRLLEQASLEQEALTRETYEDYAAGHGLHLLIAELSRNRPLFLFVHSLVNLTRHHPNHPSVLVHREAGCRAHRSITDSILNGNLPQATDQMTRHLRDIATWWQSSDKQQPETRASA